MNGLMPYTTTVSELQRNYKKVAKLAKKLREPFVILSKSKPEGIYMDYQAFIEERKKMQPRLDKNKNDFSEFVGLWSKKEADEFDRVINEMFEHVDPEMWK